MDARATSRTVTGSTLAKAKPADAAARRCGAWCRDNALLFTAAAPRNSCVLLLEARREARVAELGDIAAERCDLAHQRRRDEHVLLGGREEHGLEVGIEAAIHAGKLELVLEVRHRAQAAQHHARAVLADEIDQQAAEADHLHVLQPAERFARHLDRLVEREEAALVPA